MTSSGVAMVEKRFFVRKRVCEDVRSAREAAKNANVAMERAMIVRYWKCQP